jgi:predicted DNA-binding antitoxin AbrB/MazE fold protein
MAIVIDAVYENGSLRPDKPLPIDENARVRITVEPVLSPGADPLSAVIGIGEGRPDGAQNHDEIVYGRPAK